MSDTIVVYLDMEGNSCEPERILNGIQKALFEDFVKQLNPETSRISVTPLTPGRSGAATFLIRRVTGRNTLIPIVVKAATDASVIIKEKNNYHAYVEGKLGHAPRLVKSDSLALAYEYASSLFNNPATLRDGYSITDPDLMTILFKKIVSALNSWHTKGPSVLSNIERMELSSNLSDRISSFGDAFKKYSFLEEWWFDFKRVRRMASPCEEYISHGDLNVGNILFDITSSDPVPLFIDFGSIKECIVYWDFVKLERDLKTRTFLREALNRGLDVSDIVETVRKIDLSDSEANIYIDRSYLENSPQYKLWKCIKTLREEVSNKTGADNFNQAYYDSLLYSTLTVIYRNDPDHGIPADMQRIVACESAATLLSRILQRPLPDHLTPSRANNREVIIGKPFKGLSEYFGLTHSNYLHLIKDRIAATDYGDIRYVTIAGWEVFQNENISAALKTSGAISRPKTLRVYVLKPETKSFSEFARLSNEPPETLIEKIENTKRTLSEWAKHSEYSNLRIKLYLYDAVPVMNILETPEHFTFKPYRIGESRGNFSVFGINKLEHDNSLTVVLKNHIRSLVHQSEEITIKWF